MRNLLALLSLLFSINVYGQKEVKIYYNSQWEITSPDSVYSYVRIVSVDTLTGSFVGTVKDYSTTGILIMAGRYLDSREEGLFTYYYENGKIERAGNYSNGLREGIWKYHYPDGRTQQEVEFGPDEVFKIRYMYDSAGNKILQEGTGSWYSIYEEYEVPGKVILTGSFKGNMFDGDWMCRLSTGEVIYKQKFKKGKLLESYFTNPDGSKAQDYPEGFNTVLLPPYKHHVTNEFTHVEGIDRSFYPALKRLPLPMGLPLPMKDSVDQIYLVVEVTAQPRGGMPAFYEIIGKNLKYPAQARKNGVMGKVFVEFVINTDGTLSDVRAIKGIGSGCDEEAVRVVSLSPPWIPGTQRGEPVRQRMVLPIAFRIGR
jgi:TonB family protein